jgi:hypothetical protein
MKLFHPNSKCVSIKGQLYLAVDGLFDVPDEYGQMLLETFGFYPCIEAPLKEFYSYRFVSHPIPFGHLWDDPTYKAEGGDPATKIIMREQRRFVSTYGYDPWRESETMPTGDYSGAYVAGEEPEEELAKAHATEEQEQQVQKEQHMEQVERPCPRASTPQYFIRWYLCCLCPPNPKPSYGQEFARFYPASKNIPTEVGGQYQVTQLGYLAPRRRGVLGMSMGAGGPSP